MRSQHRTEICSITKPSATGKQSRQPRALFRCVIEVYSVSNDFEPDLEPCAAAWYNPSSRKDGGTMDTTNNAAWETLTPEEKRRALYDRQVATLKTFLEHGAITQAQHDKSLNDLTEKMGYADE